MTSASISAYTFQSTAPKDRGGAKFAALVSAQASVAPFTLYKGIGTSLNDAGYLFSHLAIGTHTQGSKVEATHPGVQLGGVYLSSLDASKNAVQSGEFRLAGITQHGEILATAACTLASTIVSDGNQTVISGSLILKGVGFVVSNGAGARLQVGDNWVNKHTRIADSGSYQKLDSLPGGGLYIGTGLTITVENNGGTTSATFYWNQ